MSIKCFFESEWPAIESAWQAWYDVVRSQSAGASQGGARRSSPGGDPAQPLFASTLGALNGRGLGEPAVQVAASRSPHPVLQRPGPFRFSTAERLQCALSQAGFEDVHAEERTLSWPFRGGAEQYWRMFSELAGPSFRHSIEQLDSERQRAVMTRAVSALNAFRTGDVIDTGALVVGCAAVAPLTRRACVQPA